jgi:hypothetical protein
MLLELVLVQEPVLARAQILELAQGLLPQALEPELMRLLHHQGCRSPCLLQRCRLLETKSA